MENTKMISEQTAYNFDKSTEHYGDSTDNYTIPRELTVTITLAEYRKLLQADANRKAEEEKNARWEKAAEVEELKAKVEELNRVIVALQSVPCKAETESEVEEDDE